MVALVVTLGLGPTGDGSPVGSVDGPVIATPVAQCQSIAKNPLGVTLIGDSLSIESLAEIEAVFAGARRLPCASTPSRVDAPSTPSPT